MSWLDDSAVMTTSVVCPVISVPPVLLRSYQTEVISALGWPLIVTVTALLFQPLLLGAGVLVADTVGGVTLNSNAPMSHSASRRTPR